MPEKFKVISIVNEDGGDAVLDISTKTQETKIFKEYLLDLIDSNTLTDAGVFDAKLLLEKKQLLLDDEDFTTFREEYTEDCFERPFFVSREWPKNFGNVIKLWGR